MSTIADSRGLRQLDEAVDRTLTRWTGHSEAAPGTAPRVARGEGLAQDLADRETVAEQNLTELLDLPTDERRIWVDRRDWHEDGVLLGERLIEAAERRPLGEQLELARLAARVSARTAIHSSDPLLRAWLDDNLGRAGLLEVRALRRMGELEAARRTFLDIEASLARDDSPLYFWLTLDADRSLTGGLLALDDGHLDKAASSLRRAERLMAVAGSENEDAELLGALVRTDLARGDAAQAVDRCARATAFIHPSRRKELGFLHLQAALRSRSPLLARRAALGLATELGAHPSALEHDHLQCLQAAVKLAESQPGAALEQLAAPAARLRDAGSLEGSLRAALVAARAELARKNGADARAALAAGVLERFDDLPATAAVRQALARVAEYAAAGIPSPEFLDQLELWLILVVDSPGVELDG